ncbi:hypothetical protein [Pedobacter psychroterrae]|uniref:Lipocalin-like protein n=1 Tax=Pedobacter psychroterrae TaxID=2530453 RepID=A0A4R0NRM1_9SPHI|nr:hypothetical protein [Pedobacter psychroterrae]TCD03790.1 hypothetical protein EZ437_07505 [Pedobacter psychroterrae]
MKKTLFALLIITTGLYLSCKKDQNGPTEFYGTWKLTETLADPGDGSGKYMKVQGATRYITFDQSGNVSGEAMPDITSYKVLDSTRIEITSKNYSQKLVYWYKLSPTTLEINPPCIEGCGFRFVRK